MLVDVLLVLDELVLVDVLLVLDELVLVVEEVPVLSSLLLEELDFVDVTSVLPGVSVTAKDDVAEVTAAADADAELAVPLPPDEDVLVVEVASVVFFVAQYSSSFFSTSPALE